MLRARLYGIGRMAIVPFRAPVVCVGYCLYIGFGWDSVDTHCALIVLSIDNILWQWSGLGFLEM